MVWSGRGEWRCRPSEFSPWAHCGWLPTTAARHCSCGHNLNTETVDPGYAPTVGRQRHGRQVQPPPGVDVRGLPPSVGLMYRVRLLEDIVFAGSSRMANPHCSPHYAPDDAGCQRLCGGAHKRAFYSTLPAHGGVNTNRRHHVRQFTTTTAVCRVHICCWRMHPPLPHARLRSS